MKNGLVRHSREQRAKTEKSVRNKLTADRSTTELRWIFLSSPLRSVNLARAIYGSKCFLVHKKMPLKNSGRQNHHYENLVAGA